jgi:hypothetical protein
MTTDDHNTYNIHAPTELPVLSKSVSNHSHSPQLPENNNSPPVDKECGAEDAGKHDDEESNDPKIQYPEGGVEAWLVVFGSFLALVPGFGIMNTLATLQAYLAKNQLARHSDGEIGWIFGVYVFLSFLGGIQIGNVFFCASVLRGGLTSSGPIFDAYGPRLLILAGTFCLVTGLMLFSISERE